MLYSFKIEPRAIKDIQQVSLGNQSMTSDQKIEILKGDIIKIEADAIVNAANSVNKISRL